ncbi:hypothetical protein [Streptomyces sp. DSM 40907]|uniref:hypothetical protein n=1 Tax=Streptomyces kutzneri TaxID=3051179 RepID=UPI0028D361AE|nr:hypothetical protein [Streptomyces sp. DSM 40907]
MLGAVLSSAYASEMPAGTPEAARHAVSEALAVAARTGDAGLAAAREAFTAAMSATFLVGVCGVLGAAVLALLLMRSRKAEGGGSRTHPGASSPRPPDPDVRPLRLPAATG